MLPKPMSPRVLPAISVPLSLLLFPLAGRHAHRRLGDVASQGQHIAQGQLGHRIGAGLGCVAYGNSLLPGISHVDVVQADAAADDDLEIRGRVNDLFWDLGPAADHHAVVVGGVAQQFLRRDVRSVLHLDTCIEQGLDW